MFSGAESRTASGESWTIPASACTGLWQIFERPHCSPAQTEETARIKERARRCYVKLSLAWILKYSVLTALFMSVFNIQKLRLLLSYFLYPLTALCRKSNHGFSALGSALYFMLNLQSHLGFSQMKTTSGKTVLWPKSCALYVYFITIITIRK